MNNIAALAIIVLSGCGQTPCQNYSITYCEKAKTCFRLSESDTEKCSSEATKTISAAMLTPEQCEKANTNISEMACSEFRTIVYGILK